MLVKAEKVTSGDHSERFSPEKVGGRLVWGHSGWRYR